MSIFSARGSSKLKVKAAPNFRTLSPVLLPTSRHAAGTQPTLAVGGAQNTSGDRQEENLGAAKMYMLDIQETAEARVDDGQAGKISEQARTDDRVDPGGVGHPATNRDDIRLHLIKGVERMDGNDPHDPRAKPIGIFTFQDSGFYDHLGPRETTAFRPDFGLSTDLDGGGRAGGVKFRPGIRGLDDSTSSSRLGSENQESITVGLEEAGVELEGRVKQVAMVPLRNKKQAQVTYAARELAKSDESYPRLSSRSSAYDYEVKLEGGVDATASPDGKESATSRCYSCCRALRLSGCRKKHNAPDEENILKKEFDMYSRFIRAKRLVGITMSLCYLTTGIVIAVVIVVTLIVLLVTS